MKFARLGDTFVARLETGEEISSTLVEFARAHAVDAAQVSGIGAAYHVVLGYFDRQARDYLRHTVEEEVEIVSLLGTIALKDGRPFPHLHVIVSGRDFRPLAGHFFEGYVGATCEVVVRPLPGYLQRTQDDATGLYLLDV